MTVVSTSILEGRCEDAKAAALQGNNLDLAEQAMRLCKPKPVARLTQGKGAAAKGKAAPAAVAPTNQSATVPR